MISDLKKAVAVPDLSLIHLNKKHIYKALGMTEKDSDEHLSALIDSYIFESKKLCHPCFGSLLYENPEFNKTSGFLYIENTTFNLGKQVSAFLSKSSQIIVFIVTCGDGIEKLSKKLSKEGHLLESLIVDIIGSQIAEELAEYFHVKIGQIAKKNNLKISNRYSPGYCNWLVSDQQNLFGLFDNDCCGVKLNPSSMMIPLKSISGIIGIGKDVIKTGYKCNTCNDLHCLMRMKKAE